MDNYIVRIEINDKTALSGRLDLVLNGEIIDSEPMSNLGHADQVLIKSLDKILQRNKIKRLSIKTLEIGQYFDESSLSYAIVRSIKSALDYEDC